MVRFFTKFLTTASRTGALATEGSVRDSIAQVHDAAVEAVLVEQFPSHAAVPGEGGLADSDENRIHEELALVDEPRVERLRREGRSPDGSAVPPDRRIGWFQPPGVRMAMPAAQYMAALELALYVVAPEVVRS